MHVENPAAFSFRYRLGRLTPHQPSSHQDSPPRPVHPQVLLGAELQGKNRTPTHTQEVNWGNLSCVCQWRFECCFSSLKIVYVARNAKDNVVSFFHFDRMNGLQPEAGDWNSYLQKFMGGKGGFKFESVWEKTVINVLFLKVVWILYSLFLLYDSVASSCVWFVARPCQRLVGKEKDLFKNTLHVLWGYGWGKRRIWRVCVCVYLYSFQLLFLHHWPWDV